MYIHTLDNTLSTMADHNYLYQQAARDTSMALIPMIFWDWQQNDPVMHAAENALLGLILLCLFIYLLI